MNPTDEQLLNEYESASSQASSSTYRRPASSSQKPARTLDHEERMKRLSSHVKRSVEGFNAKNAISFRRSSDKLTFSRPGLVTNYWLEDKSDEFFPDDKAFWPVLSDRDMRRSFPTKILNRPHRVQDPHYTVPPSNKKVKQPEPYIPKSNRDGVKLRDPTDILRDLQAKKLGASPSSASAPRPLRVENTPKRPIDNLPDSIKGVLQNITDSRLMQERISKQSSQTVNKPRNQTSVTANSSASSVRNLAKGSTSKPAPVRKKKK